MNEFIIRYMEYLFRGLFEIIFQFEIYLNDVTCIRSGAGLVLLSYGEGRSNSQVSLSHKTRQRRRLDAFNHEEAQGKIHLLGLRTSRSGT